MDSDSSEPVPGCSKDTVEQSLARKEQARSLTSRLKQVIGSQFEKVLTDSDSDVPYGTDSDEEWSPKRARTTYNEKNASHA